MEFALEAKLSAQKRTVQSINGAAPWVALGCVASFPPESGTLRIDAFDPDEDDLEPIVMTVADDLYLRAYYEPFVAAIRDSDGDEDDDGIVRARLGTAGVSLGLDRRIFDAVTRTSADPSSLATVTQQVLSEGRRHLFPDGSLVETDWDASLRTRDLG